jgi:DNA-binding NarL/FixJ family response regulator
MTPLRIIVADDHPLYRAGVISLLSRQAEFDIIGEAGDGSEAIRLITEQQPDVAIVDISMPGVTGLQVINQIGEAIGATKIIILSMHATTEHVNAAIGLGAHGYVVKTSAPGELELALRTVVSGGLWLRPSVSREIVEAYREQLRKTESLTARQSTVLKLTAEGRRTKEIAFELGISVKTVETYRTQIMSKLGLNDIPGLVRYAIRNGITGL